MERKTVEYWFPHLATLNNTADTDFTQITVHLPESSLSFVSVFAEVVVHDRSTGLGNVTRQQISLQLASAGYAAVNNTNTVTNGGEQQTVQFSGDFTSYFTTNWTGASMTCDARLLMTRSGTVLTPAWSNASLRLVVTYDYDETSATHVKTIRIPLNAPVGALATSQPGTATAVIPALDTYLPEGSVTLRQRTLVLQGNNGATTADVSVSMRVAAETTFTSQLYEQASNCAMFVRLNHVQTWDTTAARDFFLWGSAAVWHHMQAWLVVTYTFDASAANDVLVSLRLPMEVDSPMGGTAAADFQRATRELMIQEAGAITTREVAFFPHWDQLAAVGGLNMRIGTGSFVAYTDAAAVNAGGNAAMVRNDSAFTLARGRNVLNFDVYRTDTADPGYNVGGWWLVNYVCAKPARGHGSENHTVEHALLVNGTVAAAMERLTSATGITLPTHGSAGTSHYIAALGLVAQYVPSGATPVQGVGIVVERLASGEGGLAWERAYADLAGTDGETGIYTAWAQIRTLFRRWPDDADASRMPLATARRWRITAGNSVASMFHLSLLMTYHRQTYAAAQTVSGSDAGTVTCHLCRASTGERLLTGTRTGNGSMSFVWYDNTEDLYMIGEDATGNVGRSPEFLAS